MQRGDSGTNTVDELQRLREDYSIELIRRDVRRIGEIAENRCCAFRRANVEDVADRDAVAAEPPRVTVVAYLQHTVTDVRGVLRQKPLNVIAIDWPASIEPPFAADGVSRRRSPKFTRPTGMCRASVSRVAM